MILFLLLSLAIPNLKLTPGVSSNLTQNEVCNIKWSKDTRYVTTAMKKKVFILYGIPLELRKSYVIDHLVSRELGGTDEIKNLWPQPIDEARHIKDPLENRLHRLVCSNKLPLATAQEIIRNFGR